MISPALKNTVKGLNPVLFLRSCWVRAAEDCGFPGSLPGVNAWNGFTVKQCGAKKMYANLPRMSKILKRKSRGVK